MRRTSRFEHGLEVSVACNGVLVVAIYALLFHTRDMRARIPLLVGLVGPVEVVLLFALTATIGLIGLLIARGWSRQSVEGVLAGAVVSLIVLASGEANRWIPADYESSPKYGWFLVSVLLALGLLWHARRRAADVEPPDNEAL